MTEKETSGIVYDDLRTALTDLIQLSQAERMIREGRPIAFEELQELYRERLYLLADLCGHSDLYLN